MSNNNELGNIAFDLPKNQSNVIKVIGVGGGGSNAINHMFLQGIKGVDFVICNQMPKHYKIVVSRTKSN